MIIRRSRRGSLVQILVMPAHRRCSTVFGLRSKVHPVKYRSPTAWGIELIHWKASTQAIGQSVFLMASMAISGCESTHCKFAFKCGIEDQANLLGLKLTRNTKRGPRGASRYCLVQLVRRRCNRKAKMFLTRHARCLLELVMHIIPPV